MSNNGHKLENYLKELVALHNAANASTQTFNHTIAIVETLRKDPRPIPVDHNYINSTEQQMFNDNTALTLELQNISRSIENLQHRQITEALYMEMLVLGDSITNWTERYTAMVIVNASNLIAHIQNTTQLYQAGAATNV